MRAKRILLISAGVLVLLVAVAFTPSVQTWAARRVASSAKGAEVSIGRLSVGLSRVNLVGLRVETDSAILIVPSVDADMGVLPAGLGRGYRFRNLVARGWTLDLTRSREGAPSPAEAAGAWPARAIGGVLAAFHVPADLALDGVDLEGDVIFPDESGRPAGRAHVVVTGGGLAAGRDGRFRCSATAVVDDAAAPVSSVSVVATLDATMEASGTFTRAALRADATASGRDFPRGIGLSCAASAARGAGKESYSVALIRGTERIAVVDAVSPEGSPRVSGSWRLDLKDTDLAPFSLGRSLPQFHVAGAGDFDADEATGDAHAAGKLQASADRLGVLARGLGPLGHVDLAADFDMARAGDSLRVSRLEASLSGASPVASVRALQSFEFNTSTGELRVAVPSGDLVGISVTGVPLSWLRASLPGWDLSGGDARGEFVMRAEDGKLALRTRAPLTAAGVAVARAGRAAASGLELSAYVLADYAPQGWQVQLAPFAVRSGGGDRIFSLEARFGRLAGTGRAVKAAGSWSASVPAVLALPAAAGLPRFTAGEASGSFEASLDSTREVRVKLALKDLAPAPGGTAVVPTILSEVRADFEGGGRTTFSIPLRFDYGERTADIAFSGSVSTDTRGAFVNATVAGTRLSADDLATLAVLSGADVQGAVAPGSSGAASARGVPFWPAVRGRLSMKLEGIALPRFELRDVRGTIDIGPTSLALANGMASLGDGGAARVDGQLAFSPGAVRPYSMKAAVSVDNVDSAPLFRAINPDRPPPIEGRFDIASHVTGSGDGLNDLLDGIQGDFTLSSKDGKFRALRTDIVDSIRQAPSKIVDALDTVSALFGKKSENFGTALVESANGLSEIHYDQMNIAAERGADMDLRLTEINLIAPEERLTGNGRIAYVDGVAFDDQPLSVDIDLAVRGHLGGFLDVVGLLRDGQDELGYRQLNQTIHLGGSLRSIDQSQWKDILVQASLRKGSGLFDKLLGR